jgi:TonB-dependent SusC/RagA subfamily outer membrane receptor
MKFKPLQQLLIMSKFTLYGMLLQCFFFSVLFANEGNAQKYKSIKEVYVTIDFNNDDLLTAFLKIESVSDLHFAFNKGDLQRNIKLNRSYKDRSIYEILLNISQESRLRFKQVNHVINVTAIPEQERETKEREEIIEISLQAITVSGTVTSQADGRGIPGVTILVKGTSLGTATDVEGNYSIDVPNEDDILVFSSIGYAPQEVPVNGRSEINIAMAEDVQSLEEVVVVGFGTQKKVNVTGSVSTIDTEEIEKLNVTQTSQLLTGQVSGLTVLQNSGQPGKDKVDIRIRGLGTFSGAGNSPLVLVDGLASSLDNVDFNDIANISVLKDAASASIYGARAANGVILIETKKGKEGEVKIN